MELDKPLTSGSSEYKSPLSGISIFNSTIRISTLYYSADPDVISVASDLFELV